MIQKNKNYKSEQPYYQIDFNAVACQFEIRVNDIYIFNFTTSGQTSTLLPLNTGIYQKGKQQLTVRVLPLPSQKALNVNAEFKYDIKVFDAAHNLAFKQQLSGYQFPSIDQSKPQPMLEHQSEFMADVPYSIKGFQNASNLKDLPDVKQQVRAAYQQILNWIDKRDYKSFEAAFKNREKIMATTMYLDQQESADRINDLIKDFNSGFQIQPIPANASVHYYMNGKVAELQTPDGTSALTLKNNKTGEEMSIDVSLYMPEGASALKII